MITKYKIVDTTKLIKMRELLFGITTLSKMSNEYLNQSSFKIIWTLLQPIIIGKTKTIKNPFVVMIAIKVNNLPNVKETDVKNFKQLFKKELNYQLEYVQSFLVELVVNHKLYKINNYDELVMIIYGHGGDENKLVASVETVIT
ncbi:hypothetical protein RFI_02935 [Reticulomyxa filosa]|uniref:Uncharacterized protein n=1 Tax=Reticulomyxa filosa TaxID=46433 RepID=X6P7W4_RETFI|nr:hypothetical protein RFI_02935 [Reticulomyxa filosa]|eukprot:ETO34159.1 hypothetical protein RFI_02935 [Reticulomyxa filosa]